MRFLVFAFNKDNPGGGIHDLVGHYASMGDIYKQISNRLQPTYTTMHIFDTETIEWRQAKLTFKTENGITYCQANDISESDPDYDIDAFNFNTNNPN